MQLYLYSIQQLFLLFQILQLQVYCLYLIYLFWQLELERIHKMVLVLMQQHKIYNQRHVLHLNQFLISDISNIKLNFIMINFLKSSCFFSSLLNTLISEDLNSLIALWRNVSPKEPVPPVINRFPKSKFLYCKLQFKYLKIELKKLFYLKVYNYKVYKRWYKHC